MDRTVTRIGAAAAMVGAVAAIVLNLLHPRSEDIGSAMEEVRLATEEGIWRFDHYMIAWTAALLLFALIVIAKSFTREPAVSWGRVAIGFAIASTTVLFVTISVDGFALAEAGEGAEPAVAEAVAYVSGGLFLATIGSTFGVTPVIYGLLVLSGDDFPKWLGWVAILAGAIGLAAATIIFFDGFSSLPTNLLFPAASLLFTLWVGVMGYLLWQRTAQPAATVQAG